MSDAIEKLAFRIYGAMRFERNDTTKEWVEDGNSHAQTEARVVARNILAAIRADITTFVPVKKLGWDYVGELEGSKTWVATVGGHHYSIVERVTFVGDLVFDIYLNEGFIWMEQQSDLAQAAVQIHFENLVKECIA